MSFRSAVNRPFYTIPKTEEQRLQWLNDIYSWHCNDSDETMRIEKQTTYLGLYLNYSPANHKVFNASSSGSLTVFERRDYYRLVVPLIGDIIDNWVSRLTSKKPIFSVYPKKYSDPASKGKADIAKALLEAKFQEQMSTGLDEINVRNSFIQGESFLEVYWDEYEGPLDPDIDKALDNDNEELGEDAYQMRMGDVCFRLHDPRNVIVQKCRSYKDSEWVIILESFPVEQLRARYSNLKHFIQETENTNVFQTDMLSPNKESDHTLLMTMYHRPCPEMPKGWYMKATPDIIIEQGPLPCKKWIKNRRLPVLQLTDLDILGSSRGMSSTVMDKIAYGQIAHNNLWIQALMNHAYFTPKLLLQKGSLDMNQIRQSDRNILVYGKSQAKPELLVQEIVGQSTLLLMDRLKDQILKVANVMPVTRGESIPNVESRQMLDFMKDQETLQSVPKDVKHSRFLQDWAAIAFELMAEKYRQTPERIFQYFGKLKRKEIVTIAGDDIDVDVDISVDIINGMSGTLSGRMQHIQQLLTLVPNYYTPAEIIEQLEIGSPEKIYDEVTSATEAARDDIASILSGKEVPSPSRLNDLLTYYDVYIQEIQKKEIKALLPEVFDENGKDIGNKLLSQILVIETELLNIMNDVGMEMPNGAVIKKGDMPLLMAHLNVPPGTTLHQYVYGRHPTFPCLYKDSQEDLNPFKIAEDAQREMESAQIQAQNSANFGSDQGAQGVK